MSIRLIYAILYFIAGLISLTIAYIVWRQRLVKWVPPYVVTLLSITEWCWASGIMVLSLNPDTQLFWLNSTYIGITLIPASWFIFVSYYAGRYEKRSLRLELFAIHPVFTNIAVWTDAQYHWFRSDVWIEQQNGLPFISTASGILFTVHTAYSYILLLISLIILVRLAVKVQGERRQQVIVLIFGAGIPWLINVLYNINAFPPAYFDITPFAFALTGIIAYVAFRRYGLYELIPIARGMVIEHLRDPVFVLDMHDRILDINPAVKRLFDMETDALLGKHIVDLIPSYPLLVSQSGDDMPTMVPLKLSGELYPSTYEVRLQPLDNTQQGYSGGILVLHDVTSEQRARETLASYAERLRVLHSIDQSILAEEQPEDIARAGLLGLQHILDYSAALVLTRDDVDGYDFLAMVNIHGRDVDLEGWLRAMQDTPLTAGLPLRKQDLSEESVTTVLEKYLFSRGVRGYLVIPMLVTGELMGAMAFEFDEPNAFSNEQLDAALQVTVSLAVTLHNANLRLSLKYELAVRQRAEAALRNSEAALRTYAAELEAQNAELDAFAHTVAHDIKQPLAQLIGYSSLLETEYASLPEDTLLLCVNAIAGSSRKMSSITEELLLLASVRKLEEVDVQPVKMEDVIPEMLQRLERMILRAEAVVKVSETWPTVVAYAPWIEEVWVNYVSNAVKYGGTPPKIELGWNLEPAQGEQRTASVRFWVRDNGNGLTAEEQARLFVPFERLEQVRAQGHGLGLSIVQRIITKMGGRVGVESNGVPGDGCLFYFSLPLPE